MTNEELVIYGDTIKLLAVIKAAYPEFNRDVDHDAAIKIWHNSLRPYSYEACNYAIMRHIQECKFAPKIAEIIERAKARMPLLSEKQRNMERWPITDWEIRSWRRFHEELGIELPPEIMELCYGKPRLAIENGHQLPESEVIET